MPNGPTSDLIPLDQVAPESIGPNDLIITHARNGVAMVGAFLQNSKGVLDLLSRVDVQFVEWIPERNIVERWDPPIGGRFFCYGPEDEPWARPLGLGRVTREDRGALFFLLKGGARLSHHKIQTLGQTFIAPPPFDFNTPFRRACRPDLF